MVIRKQQGTSNATGTAVAGDEARCAVRVKLLSNGELVLRNDRLGGCQSKLKVEEKEDKLYSCGR